MCGPRPISSLIKTRKSAFGSHHPGAGWGSSAVKFNATECLSCPGKSVDSCLFDNFSLLDVVFKQVSPSGSVFLHIYL